MEPPTPRRKRPESKLIEHARHELILIGEEPGTIEYYLKVIRAFANFRNSGGSAAIAIPVIMKLLRYENLAPLTARAYEWEYLRPEVWGDKEGIWQNKRNSEAFSKDGGKTYYLLSETIGRRGRRRRKLIYHKSEPTP